MALHKDSDDRRWIGRHAADGDMLVHDPERFSSASANVTFFSLTQFRQRTFPPAVVQKQIEEIVDPAQLADAEARYRSWPELKAERDRDAELAREQEGVRQRERIIERHRAYVEARGIEYRGTQDSSAKGSRRVRTVCHVCAIALDDFVGARCIGCGSVLCSCGACACGAPRKSAN